MTLQERIDARIHQLDEEAEEIRLLSLIRQAEVRGQQQALRDLRVALDSEPPKERP